MFQGLRSSGRVGILKQEERISTKLLPQLDIPHQFMYGIYNKLLRKFLSVVINKSMTHFKNSTIKRLEEKMVPGEHLWGSSSTGHHNIKAASLMTHTSRGEL